MRRIIERGMAGNGTGAQTDDWMILIIDQFVIRLRGKGSGQSAGV